MPAERTIHLPAILDGFTPRKDGSLTLRFVTQELNDQAKLDILNYFQQYGWLLFKANEFQSTEVPDVDAYRDEVKTSSERLRASLFVLHTQRGGTKDDFDQFYHKHMEIIINQVKDKLK